MLPRRVASGPPLLQKGGDLIKLQTPISAAWVRQLVPSCFTLPVVSGGTTNGTLNVRVFVPKKPRVWVHSALSLKSQEILRLRLQITFHVRPCTLFTLVQCPMRWCCWFSPCPVNGTGSNTHFVRTSGITPLVSLITSQTKNPSVRDSWGNVCFLCHAGTIKVTIFPGHFQANALRAPLVQVLGKTCDASGHSDATAVLMACCLGDQSATHLTHHAFMSGLRSKGAPTTSLTCRLARTQRYVPFVPNGTPLKCTDYQALPPLAMRGYASVVTPCVYHEWYTFVPMSGLMNQLR